MELGEHLQILRKQRNLTQNELAEKLFVSRTAISKWESGRGYPSIDSLRQIAKFFELSVDALITGDELIDLAKNEAREGKRHFTNLICGVLDCLFLLFLVIPLFGEDLGDQVKSVTLFGLTSVPVYMKVAYDVLIALTVANGFAAMIIENLDRPAWSKYLMIAGVVLVTVTIISLLMTRQVYACLFCFFLLLAKFFFLLKSK